MLLAARSNGVSTFLCPLSPAFHIHGNFSEIKSHIDYQYPSPPCAQIMWYPSSKHLFLHEALPDKSHIISQGCSVFFAAFCIVMMYSLKTVLCLISMDCIFLDLFLLSPKVLCPSLFPSIPFRHREEWTLIVIKCHHWPRPSRRYIRGYLS